MASLPNCEDKNPATYLCAACSNIYNSYQSLKRHVRGKHPDQKDELAPSLKSRFCQYKCEYCTYQFKDIYNLRYHMKKKHNYQEGEADKSFKSMKKCALCLDEFPKEEIFTHFRQQHDISLELLELNFENFEDFEVWKKKIEKETKSQFCRERGVKKSKDGWIHYFVCHRSGVYKPEGKGLRCLKTQGSCKINGFCPASIKVEERADNSCKVLYSLTHIGHQNDIDHLRITEEDRQFIASKIALKVPFDDILDQVRDSVDESNLHRVHLLTKKDLCNIENSYNLGSNAIKHKYDGTSVPLLDRINSFKKRIVAIADSIESEEELKILEDTLKSIPPKIEAIKNSQISSSSFSKNSFPNNKNIESQMKENKQ